MTDTKATAAGCRLRERALEARRQQLAEEDAAREPWEQQRTQKLNRALERIGLPPCAIDPTVTIDGITLGLESADGFTWLCILETCRGCGQLTPATGEIRTIAVIGEYLNDDPCGWERRVCPACEREERQAATLTPEQRLLDALRAFIAAEREG